MNRTECQGALGCEDLCGVCTSEVIDETADSSEGHVQLAEAELRRYVGIIAVLMGVGFRHDGFFSVWMFAPMSCSTMESSVW